MVHAVLRLHVTHLIQVTVMLAQKVAHMCNNITSWQHTSHIVTLSYHDITV